MAKRKFNIYVSTKLDPDSICTTVSKLAKIEPIAYVGNTEMNQLNIDVVRSLYAKYHDEGVPKAKAQLSTKAHFNREFGEKLARKRVYRQVYADIRDDLYQRRKTLLEYIDTINVMLNYSIKKCNHLTAQIKRMNELAAEMEGDNE